MTTEAPKRTKVFISYSHADAEWLQRLRVHLRPLEREHRIEIWDDTRIKPGSRWKEEIRQAIAAAKVAVVLVSADFLASDFIATDELPSLLSAAEKEGALILPVILSPSRFSNTVLAQFQAVNSPSRPLIGLSKSEQEAELVRATEAIQDAFDDLSIGLSEQLQKGEITSTVQFNRARRKSTTAKFPKLHPMIWIVILSVITILAIIAYRKFHKPVPKLVTDVLAVHVTNPLKQPLNDVVLRTNGDSSTNVTTDASGNARLRVPPNTIVGNEVTVQVVRAPQELVFVSPWNGRVTVPSFENETQNVADVVLAARGHRTLLEYAPIAVAMVSKVNGSDTWAGLEPLTEDQRATNLVKVADEFGFTREEVDHAIRTLGERSTNPYEIGLVALYVKDYPEATKQLAASVADLKKSSEKPKSKLADAQMFLGQSLFEPGLYRESVSAYQEAVALRPDDDNLLNKLGVALMSAGDYLKAEQYLRQGLQELEHTSDRFKLARRLNRLGSAYKAQAKYAEAETQYRRSLEIWDKELRFEDPEMAACLNNKAALYIALAKYADAEALEKRALGIWEKQLGAEHRSVATALNNLAFIYQAFARFDEAKRLYQRALMIWEKQLGSDHPDTARILNNLAMIYLGQNKNSEAEQLFKRAFEIWKKIGLEHPDVARGLNNLAMVYQAQNRNEEAERSLKEALRMWEKRLGPDHPDVAMSLNNLGLLYQNTNRSTEAEPLHKKALAIWEKHFGPQHPDVAKSLNNLGLTYQNLSRKAEAEPLHKRALAIWENLFGPEHPDVALGRNNLAKLYYLQDRFNEAEPLFRKAIEIWERRLGREHPKVATALKNYAALLRKTDRSLEAEKLEARANRITSKIDKAKQKGS